jgi:hypothetical protein
MLGKFLNTKSHQNDRDAQMFIGKSKEYHLTAG